ncbi:hypothetical protein L227DRAFT_580418 [Lentinus tigrinus ALCF2SS1-6]|uniref:Uncharacterized protein n=1 Tax=Lentinus tigrinus ALCF2SS1-6 TaxID=1328759 RepID=A0A5C2RUF0_9APHY|nr:hypothetical protein L227DRAFT_580418 [Lentinus tigrinus ALCF2SS1-6]
MPNPLDKLSGWLKGSNAALFRALGALSLDPKPWLITRTETYDITVMTDRVVNIGYTEENECYSILRYHNGVRVLEQNPDGTVKRSVCEDVYESTYPDGLDGKSAVVFWVTPYGKSNQIGSEYTAYGNEPTSGVDVYDCVAPRGRWPR